MTEDEQRFRTLGEAPWLVIVNPKSGTAQPDDCCDAARELLTGQVEIREVTDVSDLIGTIRSWVEEIGPRAVVVAGGDGTVSAAASALGGRHIPMGIVPNGTANLLARELEIPLDLGDALRVVADGHLRSIDAIGLDDRVAVCQVRFGSYSERAGTPTEEFKQAFKRFAYLWKVVPWLIDPQPVRFDLDIDGRRISTTAAFVMVTNLGTVAAHLRWGSSIRPDDRAVDVIAVHAETAADYAKLLWSALFGDPEERDELESWKAYDFVEVQPAQPVDVLSDGEPVGQEGRRLRILPAHLPVYVPAPPKEPAAP